MELLKYFMQCYFNQTFGFNELDRRINDFKSEIKSTQEEMIAELAEIIKKENYAFTSKFLKKHCDIEFNDLEELKKFINYLYDKLLDRPTAVRAEDFIKKYKVVDCPICSQDPNLADLPKIIYKATVVSKNLEIYLCKLCRSVWLDQDDIQINNGQNYKEFMRANGLKGWWKELKDVDFL